MASEKDKCFERAVEKINEGREAKGQKKINIEHEAGWIRDRFTGWNKESWYGKLWNSIKKTFRIKNRLEPDDRAARGAPSPEQYRQPDCTLTLDDNSKVVIDCKFTDANGRPDEWGTKPGMGGRTQEPDYRDINKSQGNDIGEPKLDKNNCECGKRKLETEEIRVTEPALQPENRFYFAPMPGSPVPLPAPGVAPAPLPGGFPIPELVFP